MKAKMLNVLPEMNGRGGYYFVIKLRGSDGKKYDVLPSSDSDEYGKWKALVEDGIGKWFDGFQYQEEGKYGGIFNKHVLPYKLDEEEVTNTLF